MSNVGSNVDATGPITALNVLRDSLKIQLITLDADCAEHAARLSSSLPHRVEQQPKPALLVRVN